ncbi:serine/threonine-protein kinase MRCK beta-like [Cherax quadricarinatus]|uniref:serine/threonine-protein kinase MRCK beta-like n=1 Tax=Cherax quadricarinatus TaxID=27406 RepID=UPI00387E3072
MPMMGDGQDVVEVGGGGDDGGTVDVQDANRAIQRLQELERLFLSGPAETSGQSYSVETLLDVLVVLYDECTNSSLRREKTVSDFIEYARMLLELALGNPTQASQPDKSTIVWGSSLVSC